ncbi:MAG: hypothetical protein HXY23_09790 [Parvularculaceae bacterium]|nr:hypothetical protein [Parvularculaceae bacterium]
MADGRLKQIWSGFESVTTRRLTNRTVEHIVVPSRADWRDEDAAFLPRNFEGPAETAFAALRRRLAEKARHADRKEKASFGGERDTELPDVAYAAPESDAARDLIRALKATEMRTRRTDANYVDALEKPKKGLFGGKPATPKLRAGAGKPKKGFRLF